MKIAFLHYHLKPGGVTTVIRQQLQAVKEDCEVLVITGEKPQTDLGAKIIVIPEIAYDQPGIRMPSPEITAAKIIRKISDNWASGCDVLHVHNPLLAKNRLFLDILKKLSEKGVRLFLQIHDFAEDGRLRAYYTDTPYPPDCHYGVINSRDYHILLASGLKEAGLHLLQNMITPFNLTPEKKISENFVLYPVRALRRKNIGEAIFLSMFFQKDEVLAITLPPNNPYDRHYYNLWKRVVKDLNLPVLFEASEIHPFHILVQSAKRIITTSISEGFGFSFLEPWTAGQMLSGRRISDICSDFERKAMVLDHLYEKILIPVAGFDQALFYQQWKTCVLKNACQLNIPVSNSAVDKAYARVTSDANIDFGILGEQFQKHVIESIYTDRKYKKRIIELNPFLSDFIETKGNEQIIRHNRRIVETEFSQKAYQKQLLTTYQKIIRQTVSHQIDKRILAENFLNLDSFSLLKWNNSYA